VSSMCNISDGIAMVAYAFAENIVDVNVFTFAHTVLECNESGSDEFWFSDEEIDVCRMYTQMRREVTDEAW